MQAKSVGWYNTTVVKKSYIINDDPAYNMAAVKVRIERERYPELSEVEAAKKILDETQYALWKETYDKKAPLK